MNEWIVYGFFIFFICLSSFSFLFDTSWYVFNFFNQHSQLTTTIMKWAGRNSNNFSSHCNSDLFLFLLGVFVYYTAANSAQYIYLTCHSVQIVMMTNKFVILVCFSVSLMFVFIFWEKKIVKNGKIMLNYMKKKIDHLLSRLPECNKKTWKNFEYL